MPKNTMTRQHFQLIAETIREERSAQEGYHTHQAILIRLAKSFASKLAGTNSGFRRDQFLAACDPATEYRPRKRGSNQHSTGQFTAEEILSGQTVWLGTIAVKVPESEPEPGRTTSHGFTSAELATGCVEDDQ